MRALKPRIFRAGRRDIVDHPANRVGPIERGLLTAKNLYMRAPGSAISVAKSNSP